MFVRDDMWRNAASYMSKMGGECGIYLREFGEGRGELTVFYDENPSTETRLNFEEFILSHLRTRVLRETLKFRRVLVCPGCQEPVPLRSIQLRRERGFDSIICPICETNVTISEDAALHEVDRSPSATVAELNRSANSGRDKSADALVVKGKIATRDYDVFLCHNSVDKSLVKEIGAKLKVQGILPWLDEWELRPGLSWQRELEDTIPRIRTAAVFVGEGGVGPWQKMEIEAFLREFVNRNCPVIPVLLPSFKYEPVKGSKKKRPKLPVFLRGNTWVDFTQESPDPMKQLLWGITGIRGRN
jgi:hypothetical protein